MSATCSRGEEYAWKIYEWSERIYERQQYTDSERLREITMSCTWGYIWHGRYFYHSWLLWLLLFVVGAGTTVFFLLKNRHQKKCPGCSTPVDETYLRCPGCGQGLKSHCPGCCRIVEDVWQVCPYCKMALQPAATDKYHDKLQPHS